MRFTRVVLALVVLLLCAFITVQMSYAAPPMPWTTFSGMSSSATSVQYTPCGFMAVLVVNSKTAYVMFVSEDSKRIVVLYDPNYDDPEARPTEIASATVDQAQHDRVPALDFRPITGDPDVCGLLSPPGA